MSILDLVENKPKMTSIKLADYDEGGNDKGIDCGEIEMVIKFVVIEEITLQ